MLFSEVFGHNKVKDILLASVKANRVGHVYIFEGPKGVGKLSLAKAFAMYLLCENKSDTGACGKCRSCSQCQSQNHLDLKIVTNQLYDPQKKSTDILVDTIRNMKKDIYIKPYYQDRKVYIVPNADTMNVYAQNSLLKVLEEPPAYCTIILLAENTSSFLPTILSRAPILKLFPLSEAEVLDYLTKFGGDCDADKLQLLARMCEGCIGKAKELLENLEADDIRSGVLNRFFALKDGARRCIYDLSLFIKQNRDEFERIRDILQSLFVDVLYVKSTSSDERITNTDKRVKIQKFSDSIKDNCPIRLNEILFKYSDFFERNISFSLIADCLSLELWEAINDRGCRNKIQ